MSVVSAPRAFSASAASPSQKLAHRCGQRTLLSHDPQAGGLLLGLRRKAPVGQERNLVAAVLEEAERRAARLQDIFGRDSLFVELQDHGLAAQKETNPKLIEIARRLKAPVLATNDSHYTRREHHLAHDALLSPGEEALPGPSRFRAPAARRQLTSRRGAGDACRKES